MISQIISTVISFFVIYGILYLFRKRKKKREIEHFEKLSSRFDHTNFHPYEPPEQQPTSQGRPNTKFEQKKIDKQMKEFLERSPNHSFWKDHPEYLEKYLDDIDLSELDLDK